MEEKIKALIVAYKEEQDSMRDFGCDFTDKVATARFWAKYRANEGFIDELTKIINENANKNEITMDNRYVAEYKKIDLKKLNINEITMEEFFRIYEIPIDKQ